MSNIRVIFFDNICVTKAKCKQSNVNVDITDFVRYCLNILKQNYIETKTHKKYTKITNHIEFGNTYHVF